MINCNRVICIFSLFLLILFCTQLQDARASSKASNNTSSKNILFYLGCGSYSMRLSMWPLVEALTEKGHRVTFLSGMEPKDKPHPGVTDFIPKNLKEWIEKMEPEFDMYPLRKSGMLIPFWFTVPELGIEVCKKLYEDPEVLEWIHRSNFDLVFIDSFVNDCAYGLAYAFKAKTIVFSTTTLFPWFYEAFGIPDDSSWAGADVSFGFPVRGEMSFFQRATNALMPVVWKFIRELWYFPKLREVSKAGLKMDLPSFSELEKNTSLTFLTTHYSQEVARALPPNVIPIGGLALTKKQSPLPKDIQDFVDKGENGFIYISFGTVSEFSSLDKEVREAFVEGLLRFPQFQFVWKATKGVGEVELPKNFLVLKWAPQQTLLANPNIKGFIAHAGLGGINEAIYFGVPLLLMPIFAEQDYNSNLLEAKEIGVKLEITTLKAEHLEAAIKTVTDTPRMKQNMLKVSQLFKERPQKPLETSVWYTEFVLNSDASDLTEFLRPLSVGQPWWVKRQLDVWLFILATTLLVITTLLYILKCLLLCALKRLSKSGDTKNVQKMKQT